MSVLKVSVAERTMDNITVAIIGFKNFKKTLKQELDQFNRQLELQLDETLPEVIEQNDGFDKAVPADVLDTKLQVGAITPAMSGIQVSKQLNLPNYDLNLEDVEVMHKIVGIGRIQGRTTGSLRPNTIMQDQPATNAGTVQGHGHFHSRNRS